LPKKDWETLLYHNPKSPENTPKKAKNNVLTTKRILKPKYKLYTCPVSTFSLPEGVFDPLPPPLVTPLAVTRAYARRGWG